MSAMNELSQTVEELLTAAQALISAADSLTRLFNSEEPAEPTEPAKPERKPLTLEEVRGILSDMCAKGFSAQVKALIASYGAKTLKDVAPTDYDDLALAAQALGEAKEDTDA